MKGVKLKKKELKDRLKDNILDLGLCDLREIPVREMEHVREATNVNLSSNMLTSLPKNFVNLKQILILDLSRNMLKELPENFGEMTQLRHLDLYANQISRLPLSLCELKNLRWLDLKENPLTPTVASIAGQCSNLKECQTCARNIVHYLSRIKVMLEKRSRDAAAEIQTQSNVLKPMENKEKKKKKKKGDKGVSEMKKKNENETSSRTQNKIPESNNNNLRVTTLPSDNTCIRKLHRLQGIKFSSTWLIIWFFVLSSLLTVVILSWYYEEQVDVVLQNAQKFSGLPLKDYYKYSVNWLQHMVKITNVQVDYFVNMLHDCCNLEIFRNKDDTNEEL